MTNVTLNTPLELNDRRIWATVAKLWTQFRPAEKPERVETILEANERRAQARADVDRLLYRAY